MNDIAEQLGKLGEELQAATEHQQQVIHDMAVILQEYADDTLKRLQETHQ